MISVFFRLNDQCTQIKFLLYVTKLQYWTESLKWNSKPPSPQIKDEVAQKPKRAIFPSLIWWRGGYKFSIYFVQDCSFFTKMDQYSESEYCLYEIQIMILYSVLKIECKLLRR